ncbi:Tripartite tricarboxylate transporter family receptor [compost metagenome]
MPPEIVQRLHSAIVSVLRLPDVRERLASQGVDPQHNTPDEFAKLLVSDLDRWAKVVQRAGIKPE